MQIQVNTDNHIRGSDELAQHVQGVVEDTLSRFATRITRVEVHLSDENSALRSSDDDKRCVIEARVRGLQPMTVAHQAMSVDLALSGAAEKLQKSLNRTLAKLNDRRRQAAGAPSPAETDVEPDSDTDM
jgi:ribosome-associated translation inhibitor RaiA